LSILKIDTYIDKLVNLNAILNNTYEHSVIYNSSDKSKGEDFDGFEHHILKLMEFY